MFPQDGRGDHHAGAGERQGVERWPASLEYLAQLTSPAPERRVVRAPHVFNGLETAQAWCLAAIIGQGAG